MNYWWVTRPKRKLTTVPEVVALFASTSLNQRWQGERGTHLEIEDALEREGLKRPGSRRDQTGGGARTYRAWIESLGLLLREEQTGQLRLTLAGEALLGGAPPVPILKEQVLKYQFPSAFSVSRNVNVHRRFVIRPFRFLLRLLADPTVSYLTEQEIAKVVVVHAENESEGCYNSVVARLLDFRVLGDSTLDADFLHKYGPSKGEGSVDRPFGHLEDLANTLVNWLEYTQLTVRGDGETRLAPDKIEEVQVILATRQPFIDHPERHEVFQRRYGLPPGRRKDTRNFLETESISAVSLAEHKVKWAFLAHAAESPVVQITRGLVSQIAESTGIVEQVVEGVLTRQYPSGALGSFFSNYYQMAFSGRENAVDFEKATVEIMREIFGFQADHIGPLGKTPDILVLSHQDRFVGIIDNKAYHSYSLANDHRNRMVHNYIPRFRVTEGLGLAFFSYIAGGFSQTMNAAINSVFEETGIAGSGIPVSHFLTMIERHRQTQYNHDELRRLFSKNRVLSLADL